MKNYPYEIVLVNCHACSKEYVKAKKSIVEGENLCFGCFAKIYEKEECKTKTLGDLFDKNLGDEHLYLLGRFYVPFLWDDEEKEGYKRFLFTDENVNSINLLKLVLLCNNVKYQKINGIHEILIPEQTIIDLIEKVKWSPSEIFLRGIVESYSILVTSTMTLKITIKSKDILKELTSLNDKAKNSTDSLIYEELNTVDFLGKIYKNKLWLIDTDFYKQYMLMIEMYNTCKTLFAYCKIQKKDKDAVIPFKTNSSDVGFDLTVIKKVKNLTNNTVLYDTGIIAQPPKGFYIQIHPRSSLSKSGYMLANSTGIIDPGYRNTLMIALTKTDALAPDLELPFRCCQMVLTRHNIVELVEVENIDAKTSRGLGGFGSTN